MAQRPGGGAGRSGYECSDSEVLAFVRDHPNAIGYVAGDAKLGEGVKAVIVQ